MADALVCSLHGAALRSLSAALGTHIQGLQQGARLARQRGLVTPKLFRKLTLIDHAYALVRHITEPGMAEFMADLQASLSAGSSINPIVARAARPAAQAEHGQRRSSTPPSAEDEVSRHDRLDAICSRIELALSGMDLILTRELQATAVVSAPRLAEDFQVIDLNYDLIDAAVQTTGTPELSDIKVLDESVDIIACAVSRICACVLVRAAERADSRHARMVSHRIARACARSLRRSNYDRMANLWCGLSDRMVHRFKDLAQLHGMMLGVSRSMKILSSRMGATLYLGHSIQKPLDKG